MATETPIMDGAQATQAKQLLESAGYRVVNEWRETLAGAAGFGWCCEVRGGTSPLTREVTSHEGLAKLTGLKITAAAPKQKAAGLTVTKLL